MIKEIEENNSMYLPYDVRDVGMEMYRKINGRNAQIFPAPVNPTPGTTNPVGDGQCYYTAEITPEGEEGTRIFGPEVALESNVAHLHKYLGKPIPVKKLQPAQVA